MSTNHIFKSHHVRHVLVYLSIEGISSNSEDLGFQRSKVNRDKVSRTLTKVMTHLKGQRSIVTKVKGHLRGDMESLLVVIKTLNSELKVLNC